PEIELRVFSADHGVERGFTGRDRGLQRAGDETDAFAQIAPVAFAVVLAEQVDVAVGRGQVAGQRPQQRGLAAAVGAEHDPVFARLDAPIHPVEQRGFGADYAKVFNGQQRGIHPRDRGRGLFRGQSAAFAAGMSPEVLRVYFASRRFSRSPATDATHRFFSPWLAVGPSGGG